MPVTVLTADQLAVAVAQIRAGKSRNAIAREFGIGAATVTKVAQEAGLNFERKDTAAATRSRQVDIAARRAQLELDYLDDAQRLRKLIWQPQEYAQAVGGEDARVLRWETDTPIPADKLKLMQASSMAAQASQKISDAASDAGTEQAKSMLGTMMEGLGRAFQQVQNTPTPTDQETTA